MLPSNTEFSAYLFNKKELTKKKKKEEKEERTRREMRYQPKKYKYNHFQRF